MTELLVFALVCWLSGVGFCQSASLEPQIIDVPSGNLHLKAFFWKPTGAGPFPAVLFNHGSGGENAQFTAGMTMTEAAAQLAPLFVKHGYAFFYPCRRGQGLSADQAPFMQDLLKREEMSHGKEARQHLQFAFLTGDQLDDVMAAFSVLKALPDVDTHRLAAIGHSFGGQLTLLEAERDATLRAVVTFAAAANAWDRSAELRKRLIEAVGKANSPILLIHAENDYSTSPGHALDDELARLHKHHVLKIYPPVGRTPDDGHNFLYEGIPQWEPDVFQFLDQNTKESNPKP